MKAFKNLALALVGWCAALLPADRASWAAAMKTEVEAIEDGNAALPFAVGCLWGSVKERAFNVAFVAKSIRFATIGGMLALSIVSATITERMIEAHARSALVFGLTTVLFAAAAGWSCLRGPTALAWTACSMIPCYILALAFVSSAQGMTGGLDDARLYRALAIEGVFIWSALLMGAVFVLRVEALPITKDR